MNLTKLKVFICLVSMSVLLILAYRSNDIINKQLFVALGLITYAVTHKIIINQNKTIDEKF